MNRYKSISPKNKNTKMETLKIIFAGTKTIDQLSNGLKVPRDIIQKSINWIRIDLILGFAIILLFPFWGSFLEGIFFSPKSWGIFPWIWSMDSFRLDGSIFLGKQVDPQLNEKYLFGFCILSALVSKLFVLSYIKKRNWIEKSRWFNGKYMESFREIVRR